eukprot:574929-Ditylum_brightwellii.AAC.1
MTKEYISCVHKILDADLKIQNTIMATCTYAVSVMRYTFSVVKWNKGELAKLEIKTKKLITVRGFHHPGCNTHQLYPRCNYGGCRLTGLINDHCYKCAALAVYSPVQ